MVYVDTQSTRAWIRNLDVFDYNPWVLRGFVLHETCFGIFRMVILNFLAIIAGQRTVVWQETFVVGCATQVLLLLLNPVKPDVRVSKRLSLSESHLVREIASKFKHVNPLSKTRVFQWLKFLRDSVVIHFHYRTDRLRIIGGAKALWLKELPRSSAEWRNAH